ncbi:hypothetical protein JCM3774_001156 [Rhodotorula dairenensis]
MPSTRFVWAAVLALLASSVSVSATYFTSPTASTVWTNAAGQDITWKYQAGGAPKGDILLVGMSAGGSPITSMPLVVATDVDLTSESTTFPDGLQLRTATRQYTLLMVDSSNYENVYSQIGPFEIQSFAAASSSSSAAYATSSTASSASSSSAASAASTSSSSVSSSETSSRAAVTATVVETASSGVLVTMTLQPSSIGEPGAQTVTVTESASSASRAAASGGASNAGATSGAARYGVAGLAAAAGAAVLAGALVL